MPAITALLSVAEFSKLPEPATGVRQELHHGELFELPPVKKLHTRIQKQLLCLLEASLNSSDFASDKEFPFRPAPEYEVWIADVAVYSLALWEQTPDDDYFRGVPAIVIEVLSPSNTASEMLDREETCLLHGGQEFWLVDPQRQTVKVIRSGGSSHVFHVGDLLHSQVLPASIPVQDIFVF
jgi:Uma2 family endonuclease